jgi:hypothetical protein
MRPGVSIGKILAAGAVLVVALAVMASIWLDPPSENRARAVDAQRLWRLSRIEVAINDHYRLRQKLPASLDELQFNKGYLGRHELLDPDTDRPFEYEVVGEKDYRLCAVFDRSSEDESRTVYLRRHKAGRDCFDNKVVAH